MRAISRRRFLQQTSGTAALALLSSRSVAELAIGKGTLSTVSDGHLVLPKSFAIGSAPEQEANKILNAHGINGETIEPSCNISVYRDGKNTILFDVGAGPDFMPTAGNIIDSLASINVAPEDVTHVLITHAHPDHIWGLLDDFDDPVFANAVHMMGRREWDYWWNPETINTIGQQRKIFAAGARRRLEMMEDIFERFNDGEEVVSGVSAIATEGHTPGHMSFEVRSGTQASLIIGDAIVNHHLAFERPEWPSGSDQEPQKGLKTRRELFDRIITDKLSVVGFHFPGTGIGVVDQTANGYRFLGEQA
ncbi:MBL fold metallo-hydrolase [Pseudopelagicola sp. nBUS_19]|uniref:MBL fold metallo-hydrolase n=1 Tax=Pseudopelagicola sp. nBUS_19 TaxID=3395316 RepID=UPI003EC0844B